MDGAGKMTNIILAIMIAIWTTWAIWLVRCAYMGLIVHGKDAFKSLEYADKALFGNIAMIGANMIVLLGLIVFRESLR